MLSLNDLRFQQYKVLTAKSSFKLEKLPPTVEAATQHSYRAILSTPSLAWQQTDCY